MLSDNSSTLKAKQFPQYCINSDITLWQVDPKPPSVVYTCAVPLFKISFLLHSIQKILLFFTVNFYMIKVAGCMCISHPESLTEHYREADNFAISFFLPYPPPQIKSITKVLIIVEALGFLSCFRIALSVLTSQWDLNSIKTNEQEK